MWLSKNIIQIISNDIKIPIVEDSCLLMWKHMRLLNLKNSDDELKL